MNRSESIKELILALSKAQGELKPAEKDGNNPHFKNQYSTLNSIWESCRPVLSKNGLAVIQTTETKNDRLVLITTLAHISGEWFSSEIPIITQKMDPQGIGAALTYYKRYSLSSLIGVVSEEDCDAEGTKEAGKEAKQVSASALPPASPPNGKISEKQVSLINFRIGKNIPLRNKVMEMLSQEKINRLEDIPKEIMEKILKKIDELKEDMFKGAG